MLLIQCCICKEHCTLSIDTHVIKKYRDINEIDEPVGRNIYQFRYADDTTLMAEREGYLKNLLMKVKEESRKVGLKLNI